MTKYVVFTQPVSLNTILLSSFQKGGFFTLVMIAKPKVSHFRKRYFSKKIQFKKEEEEISYLFLAVFFNTVGQNIGFAGSCAL